MRRRGKSVRTAMRRVTGRGAVLAGLLLLLTFVAHHGIAAASDHPLDVLVSHSSHEEAPHDHAPHTDPVGQPQRPPRWVADNPLPDTIPVAHALVLVSPIDAFALAWAEDSPSDAVPAPAGADRRALFQVYRI